MNRHIAFAMLLIGGGAAAWWFGAEPQVALGRLAVATGLMQASVAWLRRDPKPKTDDVGKAVIAQTSRVAVHTIIL